MTYPSIAENIKTDDQLYGFLFGDPELEKLIVASLSRRLRKSEDKREWFHYFNLIRARYILAISKKIREQFPLLQYKPKFLPSEPSARLAKRRAPAVLLSQLLPTRKSE
jgi:hypothetical protein